MDIEKRVEQSALVLKDFLVIMEDLFDELVHAARARISERKVGCSKHRNAKLKMAIE